MYAEVLGGSFFKDDISEASGFTDRYHAVSGACPTKAPFHKAATRP